MVIFNDPRHHVPTPSPSVSGPTQFDVGDHTRVLDTCRDGNPEQAVPKCICMCVLAPGHASSGLAGDMIGHIQ